MDPHLIEAILTTAWIVSGIATLIGLLTAAFMHWME